MKVYQIFLGKSHGISNGQDFFKPPRDFVNVGEEFGGADASGVCAMVLNHGSERPYIVVDKIVHYNRGRIDLSQEGTVVIRNIEHPSRHAGAHVVSDLAEHDNGPPRHVFAKVMARALDDGQGAAVPDGKALSGPACGVKRAAGGAVEHGVPCDHLSPGFRDVRRNDGDPAAEHAFARVIVGIADQRQGKPPVVEGAEALAGGASEGQLDRVRREALIAVCPRDVIVELYGHAPVDVPDRVFSFHPFGLFR